MFYLNARRIISLLACILWSTVLPATGKNEAEVIVGKPKVGNLFASQYRYYQSRSAGSISVQNLGSDNLYAEVSVTVAEYAPEPLTTAVRLPARETTQVPLRIDFNREKLPVKGKPLVLEAQIEVSVQSESEPCLQKQLRTQFQFHNLHQLPDTVPEAIAAFIDASDQPVAKFSQAQTEPSGDNAKIAQRLFERMKEASIISLSRAGHVVKYPRELLRTKIGSSYDTALLYAALLENADIPVALMVSGDYILVLLQQSEHSEGQPAKEWVSWGDKHWTPLDIRMLKGTFPEAVAAGLQAYENLEGEGAVKPFILRQAWELYQPVQFVSPQSVKEMQLGITHAQAGRIDEAKQVFEKYLNDEAASAAYNNLGNIYFLTAKYEAALSHYLKALEAAPGDGAIYLNLGIAYDRMGARAKTDDMFDRSYSELGSYRQMCYALGLELDGSAHEAVRSLLREAEKRALQRRTRPLGTRAAESDSKQPPLYWKKR